MYKIVRNIIVILISAIVLSSCEDWLDLKPENDVVRQDFWKSEQQVYSAAMGLYGLLLDGANTSRFFNWGELRGDLLVDVNASNDFYRILNGDITSDNSVCDWASIYKSINQCNIFLKYAKEALKTDVTFTVTELKHYESEAYALRALLYFYLVRTFNEVPLMLDAVTSDQVEFFIPKNTSEEIFQQIYNDLDSAYRYAVRDYGIIEHNKGRITKYGVCAIMADVYLWNDDYQKCIDACDTIINSGKYGLVAGEYWLEDLFINGNSNESLFELQFSSNKTNPFYSYFKENDGYYMAPYSLLFLYESKDVRGDTATFYGWGNIYKYSALSSAAVEKRTEGNYEANWIFYRLADIFLLKAEALNELGDGDGALDLVNRIEKRAKATQILVDPTNKEIVTQLILYERKKELAYEGKRWFDVLRNAKRNEYENMDLLINMIQESAPADQVELIKSKYSDPLSHYLPIYYEEIEVNKLLEQNKYYDN